MKKRTIRFINIVIVVLFMTFCFPISIFAADGDNSKCVETNILDGCQGIEGVLDLVIDIMTIGIGILGVIGISVVGIQYLTAGGSEEKTRKAKRRMFEIVIGLVVYAVMYAILQFLLPGFKRTDNNTSTEPTSRIVQDIRL